LGFGAFWCRFSRFALLNLAAAPSFRPVRPRIVAAPIAYEQPTLNKAWEAFVAHIPTILIISIASGIFAGLAYAAQVLLILIGNGASPEALGSALNGTTLPSTLGFWMGLLGQITFMVPLYLVNVLLTAVPAMYYETGEAVTVQGAFGALLGRPWRYLLAGALFALVCGIGFCCVLPGIAVALVTPVYVNKIFTTNMPILDAFSSSFRAVYRSENGWIFIGVEILVVAVMMALTVAMIVFVLMTCGLGAIVAVPLIAIANSMSCFYVQNAAYRQGVLT
jgi:hypothetical protein